LILAAIVVFPAGMALAYPPINPVRVLPATVERGGTFNVTVTFTAVDNFTGPSLIDCAPAGWNVTIKSCQPPATPSNKGNIAEVLWIGGPYANGTNFSVLYQVKVPDGAELGNYTFDAGNLYYYIWPNTTPDDEINEAIAGDYQVQVVGPAICSTPSIDFYAALGTNPENQTLQLWSSTPCMLNWSLTDDASWLSENRTSGNCTNVTSPVALSVNSSGMSLGNYIANITISAPDANNSPRIVPVTLHIRTTGTLKVHVNFTGRGDPGTDRWVEPFVVKFFDNATKLEMGWSPINATTNAYGNFTIENVAVGTYDIGIKNRTCLSELNSSVTFTAGNVTWVNFGTIREGDVKESDKVDGFDFALLSSAYNTRPGDGNWNANADLNRSGKVDGFDFALLSSNYNARGAAYGYF